MTTLNGYRIDRPAFFLLTTRESGKNRRFRTLKEAFKVAKEITDAHPSEIVTIYKPEMQVTKA